MLGGEYGSATIWSTTSASHGAPTQRETQKDKPGSVRASHMTALRY